MMNDVEDVDLSDLDFLLSPTTSCHFNQNGNEDNTNNLNTNNQSSWTPKTDSPKKVDQLVKQMLQSATERQKLEERLQEFQQRAETIRQMYEDEKRLRLEYFQKYEEAERKFASVDHELVIKSLEVEQLQAQCAEIKPPPFEYKVLVGKYIKVALTLNEMKLLQYGELTLLKQLQKYCQEKGIKVPSSKIPKSPRKKVANVQTYEKAVQCDEVEKVHAGTQYISTVSTRGTNTNIIKTCDVGIMHGSALSQTPPQDLPTMDVMLNELLSYDVSDRRFLSPLKELIMLPKPKSKTTATCTDICNIKRKIEYVASRVETKVAATQTTKTVDNSVLNQSTNFDPQLFNKLWNTFGCMVYALMSDEQQKNHEMFLEEKFSATMGFNKDTLKAWLSQACALPSLTTNTQANFCNWKEHNYSDFKYDACNSEKEETNNCLFENNNTADADIQCMELLPDEIIVLDAINNEEKAKVVKKHKNKQSNMLATKERKRLKHLKKQKEIISTTTEATTTNENEFLQETQNLNIPKLVNIENVDNQVIHEKRKNLQQNIENESETKKLRLNSCVEELPIEYDCESPKLVIDFDECDAQEVTNTPIEEQDMIDECVKNMSVAFENNEFAQLKDSELQDVLIKIFGDETELTDEPPIKLNTSIDTQCIMDISEPDNINDCQVSALHTPKEIPLDLKMLPAFKTNNTQRNCLMYKLVKSYSLQANKSITGQIKMYIASSELRENIIAYINNSHVNEKIDILNDVFKKPEHLQSTAKCKQIANVIVRFIRELTTQLQQHESMQQNILNLISVMLQNAPLFITVLTTELEQTIFNPVNKTERLEILQLLNLTSLYLLIEQSFAVNAYSARLFIAKALYYYNILATPMINMVLTQYPTALPHREDRDYNTMDPLVNVIQHLLMCTKYDMDNDELQHREFLSKLRFIYHYEPFLPNRSTVLNIIFTNLHTQQDLEKIPYALALLCKRWDPQLVMKDVIQAKLLPLINSWRSSEEYSARLAVVFECLSLLVKPFPLQTDVSVYLCIFEQFITAANKNLRESAVRAILRFQRFGYVNCFNSLLTLNVDTAEFQADTLAMLHTFIHRKSLNFWQNVCPDVFNV